LGADVVVERKRESGMRRGRRQTTDSRKRRSERWMAQMTKHSEKIGGVARKS